MLYFGWQQTQLLPSLIWLSYLHIIKIAYASWCTDAFSWAANSVCPALLLLAKQSLRLTGLLCPCPWPWWSWDCQCRFLWLYKTYARFHLPLCWPTKSIMPRSSSSQILLRKHQTLESSRTFNTRFPIEPTKLQQKRWTSVWEVRHTRKKEWLIFCLLLIETDLLHGSIFINSRQKSHKALICITWHIQWM